METINEAIEVLSPDDEQKRQEAKAAMEHILANPPSKQTMKSFLTHRANTFIVEHSIGYIPRKDRRKAAKQVAKRALVEAMSAFKSGGQI